MARRRIPDPRVDPHEPNETTPCESCRIDLLILKRAHELTVEQGHARHDGEPEAGARAGGDVVAAFEAATTLQAEEAEADALTHARRLR